MQSITGSVTSTQPGTSVANVRFRSMLKRENSLDPIPAITMTTIHVQRIGDKVLLPQSELEQLVELARLHQGIAVEVEEDDVPTMAIMRLAEQGGAFDFWQEAGEDIYTQSDGESL